MALVLSGLRVRSEARDRISVTMSCETGYHTIKEAGTSYYAENTKLFLVISGRGNIFDMTEYCLWEMKRKNIFI